MVLGKRGEGALDLLGVASLSLSAYSAWSERENVRGFFSSADKSIAIYIICRHITALKIKIVL